MRSSPQKSKSHRTRPFKPTADGLEPRIQLTAQAVGAVGSATLVGSVTANPAPQADIVLENLNVQSLGNNEFKVTATLENEGLPLIGNAGAARASVAHVVAPPPGFGVAYPGGGILQITRTSGGTILNSQPTGSVLSTPVTPQVIASMPIPALNFHQSIQLSTVTTGRAIFTGSAVAAHTPIGFPLPFPDANKANDTRTVDNLIQHTFVVNTLSLSLVPSIANAVHNAQLRLDSNDSFVVIPGFVNTHFKIPAQTVSVGVGPFSVSASYTVNNLVSTSAALSYEQGGLAITVNFADNAHALHTSSSLFPDIGVTNLQVKVFLPLSYNAQYQYFQVGKSKTTVTGNWHAGGPFGSVIDLLLPNINQKVSSAVTSLVNANLNTLSFQLTKPIHDLVSGGRIVSANIQQNQMTVTVETPN
jgi:hypothetical protein